MLRCIMSEAYETDVITFQSMPYSMASFVTHRFVESMQEVEESPGAAVATHSHVLTQPLFAYIAMDTIAASMH